MKAYEIKLKRNDVFCYYLREGNIITLVTDEEHPYPCTYQHWIRETDIVERRISITPEKIIFATCAVKKEEFPDFLQINIPLVIEQHIKLVKDINTFITLRPYALTILTKEWDDVIEIGMGIRWGHYHYVNEYAQKIVNSYLNLKAFW
jgi:hypothetical protein